MGCYYRFLKRGVINGTCMQKMVDYKLYIVDKGYDPNSCFSGITFFSGLSLWTLQFEKRSLMGCLFFDADFFVSKILTNGRIIISSLLLCILYHRDAFELEGLFQKIRTISKIYYTKAQK